MLKSIFSLFNPLPSYLAAFYKADYEALKYGLVAVFLAICLGVNYYVSFQTNYVVANSFSIRLINYTAFYGFAYFGGVLIVSQFSSSFTYIKNPKFWLITLLGVIILSLHSSFFANYDIAKYLVGLSSYLFVGKLISEFRSFITMFLPLLLLWYFIKQQGDSFFGLTFRNVDVKPYAVMIVIMAPLILLAAQTPSFLSAYPMFKSFGVESVWEISVYWLVVFFEFLYASAFLTVELFFRGFLVIGLTRMMGKDAVIPMVCLYAFLHFQKPMGEAISSIFGGYLLGVFAYYSKNIWGGIFVHVGIALLMELAATWMKM